MRLVYTDWVRSINGVNLWLKINPTSFVWSLSKFVVYLSVLFQLNRSWYLNLVLYLRFFLDFLWLINYHIFNAWKYFLLNRVIIHWFSQIVILITKCTIIILSHILTVILCTLTLDELLLYFEGQILIFFEKLSVIKILIHLKSVYLLRKIISTLRFNIWLLIILLVSYRHFCFSWIKHALIKLPFILKVNCRIKLLFNLLKRFQFLILLAFLYFEVYSWVDIYLWGIYRVHSVWKVEWLFFISWKHSFIW